MATFLVATEQFAKIAFDAFVIQKINNQQNLASPNIFELSIQKQCI